MISQLRWGLKRNCHRSCLRRGMQRETATASGSQIGAPKASSIAASGTASPDVDRASDLLGVEAELTHLETHLNRDRQCIKVELSRDLCRLQDSTRCHGYHQCMCLCHYYWIPSCRCKRDLIRLVRRVRKETLKHKSLGDLLVEKRIRDEKRTLIRLKRNAASRKRYRDRHWQ